MDHWLINCKFGPAVFEDSELGVKVHQGMYEAALAVYNDILPVVQQHLASSPTAKVCLTGHSLGGALASLLMLMMVWRGDVPPGRFSPCFTFGAPAAFYDQQVHGGSEDMGIMKRLGLSKQMLVNVMMHLDIVPRSFACDIVSGMVKYISIFQPYMRGRQIEGAVVRGPGLCE